MKILQIYKTYYPDTFGGIESVIQSLAHETQALGAEQTLLTVSSSTRKDTVNHLPVIRYKKNLEIASCPFSLQFFKNFKQIAQNHDILHFHYPWPFADFTDLLRKVDRPSLVTFHADAIKHTLLKKIYSPFQQAFFKKVNHIVPTSLPLLRTSADLQDFKDKCRVIPLGIEPAAYPKANKEILKKWQTKLGKDFVFFMGVLRHYKGLDTLIDSAKNLNLSIVIAGSGPCEAELKAKAEGLNNIHFLGRVSEEDKVALYQLCSMVVLPSHNRAEAFGITLLEGLMYQKPLISTELGTGTSYVNQDGETGFVIPPNNSHALCEAITKLQNPELAEKMGKSGYAWFLKEFQSAIMGQRYFELYQSLLK